MPRVPPAPLRAALAEATVAACATPPWCVPGSGLGISTLPRGLFRLLALFKCCMCKRLYQLFLLYQLFIILYLDLAVVG